MKLKTKLFASTVAAGTLVAAVGGLMVYSQHQVELANDNMQRATAIVNAVSQVRFLTFENLLHQDQRSREQWEIKVRELPTLLAPPAAAGQNERAALAKIRRLSDEVVVLFGRVAASQVQSTSGNAAAQRSLQERLATQILIRQQEQIDAALGLASDARQSVVVVNGHVSLLVGGTILFMVTVTIANFLLFTRTVTASLRELQKGAEAIAAGHFGYRIKLGKRNDEFSQVAAVFNSMATETGRLDKTKSDLILLTSHQLRTPLTAVKWYASALEASAGKRLSASQMGQLRQIISSNERMIKLVDKLLSASLVEKGRLDLHPRHIVLQDILDDVLADLSVLVHEGGVAVAKNFDASLPAVSADPVWTYAIFQSLISNAVRYSRHGQRIRVTIRKTPGEVLLTVADKGYGIPAADQAKIFTKLFRADNASRIVGEGSGLDLYITKAIVEQAGGTIWFKSVENKGTTFYVRLPVSPNG